MAVTQACGSQAARVAKEIATISGQESHRRAKHIDDKFCTNLWSETASKMNASYPFDKFQLLVYNLVKSLPMKSGSVQLEPASSRSVQIALLIGILSSFLHPLVNIKVNHLNHLLPVHRSSSPGRRR